MKVIRKAIEAVPGDFTLNFWCPGCKSVHGVHIRPSGQRPAWTWNGCHDHPTFTPSILITWKDPDSEIATETCHSFVTASQIRFLEDCTHELAGQTVMLPDVEDGFDALYESAAPAATHANPIIGCAILPIGRFPG